jgi:DNA-binding protein YbaB
MMFGGGGKQEGGGFMEQMKAAKEMFNPENMKKYAALGEKIQSLQTELAQTEVEVATNGGDIVVKTSAMQVRASRTRPTKHCVTVTASA